MKKLVGLAGPSGCGKDTIAKVFVEKGWRHEKFSRRMKDGLKVMLGLTEDQVNGHLRDDMITPPKQTDPYPLSMIGKTPRELLKSLGDDWGQKIVHEDIWIWAVEEEWRLTDSSMVISDVRFPRQADWIRANGGKIVHISTPDTDGLGEFLSFSSGEDYVFTNHFEGTDDLPGRINNLIVQAFPPTATAEKSSVKTMQSIISTWADDVFPQRTIANAIAKLMLEEIPEYLTSQHDPMELADCAILIYDIAHLAGIDLEKAMLEKMEINRKRSWGIDKNTGLMKHVKENIRDGQE